MSHPRHMTVLAVAFFSLLTWDSPMAMAEDAKPASLFEEPRAVAGDCAVLPRLGGSWTGRGSLRRHSLSGAEPMRCRLINDWDGGSREMTSRLDCRGVDGDLSFLGSIAAVGSEGLVAGLIEGSQGLEEGILDGWCEAGSLRFALTGRNPTTGDAIDAGMVLALSDDGESLINAMRSRDPESGEWYSALEVRFER